MSKPNETVRILMERDGMTREEAEARLEEVRELATEVDPWDFEDLLADELGLEMDYIFDFID